MAVLKNSVRNKTAAYSTR